MLIISMFDLSSLIKYTPWRFSSTDSLNRKLTRFLHDLYSCFVCTIYMWDGLHGVIQRFHKEDKESAFFAAVLATVTVVVGLWLGGFHKRRFLTKSLRKLVVDYALAIAIAIAIFISYHFTEFHVDRIPMPEHFGPTDTGREWLVPLELKKQVVTKVYALSKLIRTKQWLPALAAAVAIPIVFLFFIDQVGYIL